MKKVEAIKPFKLESVKEALALLGVEGMTVSEVKWFGPQKGHMDDAVQAIVNAARTGKIGDGKVLVNPVEDAVRIQTEETGDHAV